MNRRDFLQTAGLVSASLAFPKATTLLARDAAADANWRTFEVVTRVEVLKPSGATRIWIPAALTSDTPFQKTLSNTFNAESGSAKLIESKLRLSRNHLRRISSKARNQSSSQPAALQRETTLSIFLRLARPATSTRPKKLAPISTTSSVPRNFCPPTAS